MLLLGAAIVGGVLGLFKGSAKAKQRQAEYDDKVQELNRQQATLDTNYNQAKGSYDLVTGQAEAIAAENKAEYGLLAEETLANRDISLGVASKSGHMQSEINSLQVATLAVDNKQNQGQARSQAASSGFRDSGTSLNVVDNATRQGDSAMEQAKMQVKMSNYQSYSSTLSNYTSANQQADAYERKIVQTENTLQRALDRADLQLGQATDTYKQQGGYLGADINELKAYGDNGLEKDRWADLFGAGVSGALQGAALFA